MKRPRTPHDHRWTLERVRNFRRQRHIQMGATARQGGDFLTANEAADYFGISRNGLLGLERLGAPRNQITDFAPWRLAKISLTPSRSDTL